MYVHLITLVEKSVYGTHKQDVVSLLNVNILKTCKRS